MSSAMDVDGGGGRRGTKRSRGSANPKGKRRKAGGKSVKSAVQKALRAMQEMKYTDTGAAHSAGNVATITALTAIAAGDTNVTRSGRKVHLKSLQYKHTALTDNDNLFGDIVRIIIFRDNRQVGDTIPTAAQLLEAGTNVYSFINKNNQGRFTILQDRFITISPAAKPEAASANTYGQPGNWWAETGYRKLGGIAAFNGDATTDIEKNGIYILQMADRNTVDQYTTITSNIRIRWADGA